MSIATRAWGWTIVVAAALALAASSLGKKKDDPFIFLNENEILQVEFIFSADPRLHFDAPSVADSMEDTAHREFAEAFAAVIERAALPIATEIIEQNDRPGEGLPVLEVHAVRWQVDHTNSLEAVLRVKLRSDEYENFVGSFRARDSVFGINSESRMSRTRIEVMTKALAKAVHELQLHFKLPGE